MSLTKLTAIRQLPDRANAVPNGRLTDKVEWLTSNDEYKYWALFQHQVDGGVAVKTYCGRYEDECHGTAYTPEAVEQFKQTLVAAGFMLLNTAGDMSNLFD
jgi:hypothetical protein